MLTIKTTTLLGLHFSGMIASNPLFTPFEQRYGYFEARIKFDTSPGMWSSFLLHSASFGNPVGDPATAGIEMDIGEHRARCVSAPAPTPASTCSPANDITNRMQHALIWDGYGADSKSFVKLSDPLPGLGNGSWHAWGLHWTPTSVTFYYDGVAVWSQSAPISQRPEFIVLSSEVGRFFAGPIPLAGYGSAATSTTKMQVDWVRAYALSAVSRRASAPAPRRGPGRGRRLPGSAG